MSNARYISMLRYEGGPTDQVLGVGEFLIYSRGYSVAEIIANMKVRATGRALKLFENIEELQEPHCWKNFRSCFQYWNSPHTGVENMFIHVHQHPEETTRDYGSRYKTLAKDRQLRSRILCVPAFNCVELVNHFRASLLPRLRSRVRENEFSLKAAIHQATRTRLRTQLTQNQQASIVSRRTNNNSDSSVILASASSPSDNEQVSRAEKRRTAISNATERTSIPVDHAAPGHSGSTSRLLSPSSVRPLLR